MNDLDRLKKCRDELDKIIKSYQKVKMKNNLKERERYIGKCYKSVDDTRYYKVISTYAPYNENLTCIVFDSNLNNFSFRLSNKSIFCENPYIYTDLFIANISYVRAFNEGRDFFRETVEIPEEVFNKKLLEKMKNFIKESNEIHEYIDRYVKGIEECK